MVGTVQGWLDAYLQGDSPRELLAACRERLQRDSPHGVWIHLASNREFDAQLDALDAMLAETPDRDALLRARPLFGVPFAVKDNIDIADVPTTAACPAFAFVPSQTATAVAKLLAAGAVWLGKTNLDQFATGLVGTRSPFGQPACVFSADHISGGSSSGSAVAVARGDVAFALGTDTAGSGRIPAAFNQLVGLKPTPGRVSMCGVLPACRTVDCVSIFALTVADAGHVLSVIEGCDERDVYSRYMPGPDSFAHSRLRIGVPAGTGLAPGSDYSEPYARALDHAAALGHITVSIDFAPLHRTADLLYSGPWVAERHAVVQALLDKSPEAIDPVVRAVIGTATRFSATDAFRAQYELEALRRETAAIWDRVDLLLVPSAPLHPRFGDIARDPIGINSALGTYTNFVNLLGWSAIALPAGSTAHGLPFGVTAIAPSNHDAALVAFGRAWQESLDLLLGATLATLMRDDAHAVALRRPASRPALPIAVVGAHLSGMPLNGQLTGLDARLSAATATAAHYRLYALPGTTPPKPGLVRVKQGGHRIAVEVWDMPSENAGAFLALIPAPLGLGKIELTDGRWVHGFVCEAQAVAGAEDISSFGGWRAWLDSRSQIQIPA